MCVCVDWKHRYKQATVVALAEGQIIEDLLFLSGMILLFSFAQ